jgi:hypothetical protein
MFLSVNFWTTYTLFHQPSSTAALSSHAFHSCNHNNNARFACSSPWRFNIHYTACHGRSYSWCNVNVWIKLLFLRSGRASNLTYKVLDCVQCESLICHISLFLLRFWHKNSGENLMGGVCQATDVNSLWSISLSYDIQTCDQFVTSKLWRCMSTQNLFLLRV